jgi:exodeoxyribonuclease V alpha subunit
MLGSDGDSLSSQKKDYDLIVVDEFSMSDQWVSTAMLSMIRRDVKLVFVGDADQLPSVGPGSVLHEMIASEKIPVVQLKKVFRQASGSSIAENARRIANSVTKLVYDDDFIFMPADNQEQAMGFVCQLYERAVKSLGADQVQILTPMRSRGECSVKSLNTAIQRIVQGNPEMGYQAGPDKYYCVGDPVIQLKNVNGINNGDLGTVKGISGEGVSVQYPGVEAPKKYSDDDLRIIQLAYSLTVHKSLGSEYPIVIMPVLREHTFMLTRNLLYTGITRGKNRVVIVGDAWALKTAILKKDTNKRHTHLAKRIAAFYDKLMEESDTGEPVRASA